MEKLKSSEEMLRFLKELSSFSEKFSVFQNTNKKTCEKEKTEQSSASEKKETPQSPTTGIADAFIQSILDSYFKKSDNS